MLWSLGIISGPSISFSRINRIIINNTGLLHKWKQFEEYEDLSTESNYFDYESRLTDLVFKPKEIRFSIGPSYFFSWDMSFFTSFYQLNDRKKKGPKWISEQRLRTITEKKIYSYDNPYWFLLNAYEHKKLWLYDTTSK